ncbi:hypothetical protein [Mycobacterium aquaticum]|uniref:DUF4355 domain-containing protein n=1 Tax=Mycobacterium aquaticum TaxID=1927124 RepID=A0A1W9ZZY4_9MYCO|nr:hypothetical protein [Mycobacterium aquaticum]ORA23407.1 hypothetical protein BST13_35225 [Mycobacterium aquaticum]
MSEINELPIHPTTGLRAIGIGKRGPWWPVMGGSGEGDGGAGDGDGDGGQGDAATGSQGADGDKKPTETVEFWKGKAREQETRAKANAAAAKKLAEIEEANKSEAQKAADRIAKAEAEVAGVPAKVAEGLKAHLVALHKIADEDAELFLTATDPDLLLKQAARLLAQSGGKRKNNNYVADQGNGDKPEKPSGMREFTRELFGNNT